MFRAVLARRRAANRQLLKKAGPRKREAQYTDLGPAFKNLSGPRTNNGEARPPERSWCSRETGSVSRRRHNPRCRRTRSHLWLRTRQAQTCRSNIGWRLRIDPRLACCGNSSSPRSPAPPEFEVLEPRGASPRGASEAQAGLEFPAIEAKPEA